MKAKLKLNEFLKAVKLCSNAIDPKDAIRSNIRFDADGDQIIATATNNQYSIETVCSADISEEGSALVDGKNIYSVLSKGSGECVLTSDDKCLTVKTNGRTKLNIVNHDLSPIEKTNGKQVVFDSVEFRNAINKIEYAVSEDQSRLILTGAHIVSDGMNTTITALDGFRLAQTQISCHGDEIDIIVPTRILDAICDAVTEGELTIISSGNRITVIGNSFVINALTLTGNYIDTARIIPTDFRSKALIKTVDIKDCADSAIVASGSSNLVKLNIKKDSISIASNSEGIDFNGEIDAMTDGEELTIAFNLQYLVHDFNHINTEQCELRSNSPVSPVIIVPYGEDADDLHLILPVRVFS